MQANTYPGMATQQWRDVRESGAFTRQDMNDLLTYWGARRTAYAGKTGTFSPVSLSPGSDVASAAADFARWDASAKLAKKYLASPTQTFNYRHQFEEDIHKFALTLEGLRVAAGWPVAEFFWVDKLPKKPPPVPVEDPTKLVPRAPRVPWWLIGLGLLVLARPGRRTGRKRRR